MENIGYVRGKYSVGRKRIARASGELIPQWEIMVLAFSQGKRWRRTLKQNFSQSSTQSTTLYTICICIRCRCTEFRGNSSCADGSRN